MKNKTSTIVKMLFALALLIIAVMPVNAMNDPSQVYCESLGYTFITEKTQDGYTGYCMVGGEKVDSWKFIKGEVASESSVCAKKGYTLKKISDPEKCWYTGTDECAVCVQADGSEVEVTKVMNLSFYESTCGDGICGMPENYQTCSQDCTSGGIDHYCDNVKDSICDPDCDTQADPDCTTGEQAQSTGCLPMLPAILAIGISLLLRIPYAIHKK